MTKIRLDADERYPDYFETDDEDGCATEVEVDDEMLERWRRVSGEYVSVQREMRKAVKDAVKAEKKKAKERSTR
jgi:hypothetical protein